MLLALSKHVPTPRLAVVLDLLSKQISLPLNKPLITKMATEMRVRLMRMAMVETLVAMEVMVVMAAVTALIALCVMMAS